jgi:hypothetical protein
MSSISLLGRLQQPNLLLRIIVVSVLALCVAAAYLPILGAGWVFDDVNLVQPSPALKDLSGLGRAISTDLYRQAAPRLEASPYWRPLAMASFWLDTRIGTAPIVLHIGNIFLHAIIVALLAFVIMRRYGGAAGIVAALVASAWWGFHPENAEVVSWVSCRYDLLCGAALLCLLVVPWRPGPLRAALFGLIFLAGLLSKEGFGAMAIVVVAMDFADKRPVRDAIFRWGGVVLALIIWVVLRALIGIRNFDMPNPEELLAIIGTYPQAIAIYFWRALTSPALTISHPFASGGLLWAVAGIAILAVLVIAVIKWRRLAVPVAIFLAGLIPSAGAIVMFHEAPERYLYIPSIGLAMLVGELTAIAVSASYPLGRMAEDQAKRFAGIVRIAVPAVFGIMIVLGLIQLEQRLPDWKSDSTLWTAALRVDPIDPQANFNKAIAAGRENNWGTALRAIETASQGDRSSGKIASTYAWVLLRLDRFAGAAIEAERATTLTPYQPDGWYYLAFARHKMGDHSGELAAVDKLLEIAPDYPGAREMRDIASCEVSGRTDCNKGK